MSYWLARWTPDREVRVRALAGSLCCDFQRDTLLSQCLSPSGNLTKYWEVTCDGLSSHPGGVAILLVASCYGNQDKL